MPEEIPYSDIKDYIGYTLTFEEITTGKQIQIHLSKIKGDIIYGTGVSNNRKIYYELPIAANHTKSKIFINA